MYSQELNLAHARKELQNLATTETQKTTFWKNSCWSLIVFLHFKQGTEVYPLVYKQITLEILLSCIGCMHLRQFLSTRNFVVQ